MVRRPFVPYSARRAVALEANAVLDAHRPIAEGDGSGKTVDDEVELGRTTSVARTHREVHERELLGLGRMGR